MAQNRYNFESPGGSARDAIQELLLQREAQKRQAMLYELNRKQAEAQMLAQQEQTRLARDRFGLDTQEFGYKKERDTKTDAYTKERDTAQDAYTRERDFAKLGESQEERNYNRGRDARTDERQVRADALDQRQQAEIERHNKAMEALAGKKDTPSGRPMLGSQANAIADINSALDDVDVLERDLGTTGAESKLGAMLPNVVTEFTGIGSDAKQRQAVIDRVKQVIGKNLEGGVLRKEDEIKYEKILPTIGDPPEVAGQKLAGLREALQRKRQTLIEAYADAGYETTASEIRVQSRTGGTPASKYKVTVE